MSKTFTTPKGVAYYPYISAPDTKFDEQGHYKVNLCIPKEEAEPIIEQIKGELVAGIGPGHGDVYYAKCKQHGG